MINYLIDADFNFRDMSNVIDAFEEEDPTQYRVPARMLQEIRSSLKVVHPSFHAKFSYNLDLHMEIAELSTVGRMAKGRLSNLKRYAGRENNEVHVACYSPFVKDVAYMLEEVGKLFQEVELNGYFQLVVNNFEKYDAEEVKKSTYPTAFGRILLMAITLTFPNLIEKKFDTDACAKAILDRVPPTGGFGKPRKKRGEKRARSPSPSHSEIHEIHRLVGVCDEDDEEELESGQQEET